MWMKVSVIIPAYNEEKCLAATLESVKSALALLEASELVVVDNNSTDKTRAIAEAFQARIVLESEHIISKVRNTGAASASGETLIFIDADTSVPETLLAKIADVMADEKCFGGAVAVRYGTARRKWIQYYLLGWQFWGADFKRRQGAAQFCRRSAFNELGGYDESIFMGEDVEFHWRLSKLAKSKGCRTHFIESPRVTTSARRYDHMGLWKTLLLTHLIIILFAWRTRRFWKDWYENAVR